MEFGFYWVLEASSSAHRAGCGQEISEREDGRGGVREYAHTYLTSTAGCETRR